MRNFDAKNLRYLVAVVVLFGIGSSARAQLAAPAKEIPLYPGAAPGSETWNWTERLTGAANNPTEQNVVHPTLMYYPAEKSKAVGTAMIVAPGGGFQNLMMSYEGVDVAKRLNEMGVDAFVLKYRLRYTNPAGRGGRGATQPAVAAGPTTNNAQAYQDIRAMGGADGQQSVKLLRESAAEYGFKPDRIGIMGFSAGGAVVVRTIRGPAETRPNFAAAIYAAEANGDNAPAGAPPLFIAVSADDQSVGWAGSFDMFAAWRRANIPVELHIFQTGAHGFRKFGGGADHYMDRLEEWMKVNHWLDK